MTLEKARLRAPFHPLNPPKGEGHATRQSFAPLLCPSRPDCGGKRQHSTVLNQPSLPSLPVYLTTCLPPSLPSPCLPACQAVYPLPCLPAWVPASLSTCLGTCFPAQPPVCVHVCLPACCSDAVLTRSLWRRGARPSRGLVTRRHAVLEARGAAHTLSGVTHSRR